MKTQLMLSTQVSVQEIQHLNTFYQYQDTVELQGTLLTTIMDPCLPQEIRTMTDVNVTVDSGTRVAGGTEIVTIQTSMVSIRDTHPTTEKVWNGMNSVNISNLQK